MPVNNIIQLRKGNSAQWSANSSVVLASGEPGFDLDKNLLKIGDGSTSWSSLPPVASTLYQDLNTNTYSITGVGNIDIDGDLSVSSGNFTALSINASNGGFVFPTGDGANGQILKTDGLGNVVWGTDSTAAGGSTLSVYSTGVQVGDSDIEILDFSNNFIITETPDTHINISLTGVLENVVEDTSPQLGGNLDLNSHDITGVPGADFKIGYEAGYYSHHDGYTLVTDTTNRKVGINTNGFQSYALDIGKGVNATGISDMRVEQIVPHVSLLLGTNHSSSTLSPQGGMSSPACIGNGAAPTTSKALNFATNYFSTAGDAQKVTMAVQYESTDASTYYLNAAKTGGYLYSTYVRYDTFILPADSSATFTIHLIANNDTDSTSAGWIFRGCVKSVNKSLSFVGSPIVENFNDAGMSGAAADIEVQDGSGISAFRAGGLLIKVNGLSGKTIRWVATIDAVLTSF